MEKIKMVAGTVGNAVKSNKENLVLGLTAGAIGAALFGYSLCKKGKGRTTK